MSYKDWDFLRKMESEKQLKQYITGGVDAVTKQVGFGKLSNLVPVAQIDFFIQITSIELKNELPKRYCTDINCILLLPVLQTH